MPYLLSTADIILDIQGTELVVLEPQYGAPNLPPKELERFPLTLNWAETLKLDAKDNTAYMALVMPRITWRKDFEKACAVLTLL